MILTCPACQTQYVIPEDALGTKARKVRCASCNYNWRQDPITVTEIDLSTPHSFSVPFSHANSTADDDLSAAEMARQLRWQQALHAESEPVPVLFDRARFKRYTAIWLLGLFVATIVALGYARAALVRAVPSTALLYEAVGLPAPAAGQGLKFGRKSSANLDPQAVPARLHVKGEFTNTLPYSVRLPILQARLFTADGKWLKDWAIPLQGVSYIGGKRSLGFDYTLPQIPEEGQRLTFRFTDE
jgi:predicted Zn finger-like uncharacterized protein